MRSIGQLLALSLSLALSLTVSHFPTLCMFKFSLRKVVVSLYLYLNAAHAVRTLSSVAAASGRKTQLPTVDCRLLWAATTLQCPWMTLLLRPSRRRCHYNWRCCHGCHDERWQNKEEMEFNWNWNFSYLVSIAWIVLSLVCSFLHHHEQVRRCSIFIHNLNFASRVH